MAGNSQTSPNKIAICMGSQSDWRTMQDAASMLDDLGAAYEVKIISAHRTPARIPHVIVHILPCVRTPTFGPHNR